MTKPAPPPRDLTLIHIRKSVVERARHSTQRHATKRPRQPTQKELTNAIYSEQRQLDNCTSVCNAHGWRYEVYADVERGHHSGLSDKGRKGWANLRAQLDRPEVRRVMVETLSRAYRNVRLLLELLDNELAPRGIELVIATMPTVDFRTPEGRQLLISLANNDEYRARMDGKLMSGAISNLQKHGRHWGKVPFGLKSVRLDDGYRMLEASDTGVWIKGNQFREGVVHKPPKGAGWEWRGDYECCLECWRVYVTKDIGAPLLAEYLNARGYKYRSNDKTGRRHFTHDSVRAILDSALVYLGYIMHGGTRAHRGEVVARARWKPLADERLLKQVLAKRQARYFHKASHGRQTRPPMLLQGSLLRCAVCGAPWYADPGDKATHTQTYYHAHRFCESRKRVSYIHAPPIEDEVLDMIEAHLDLPTDVLERIAEREQMNVRGAPTDPKRAVQARLKRIEEQLRRLHLPEDKIRQQLAEIEAELTPVEQVRDLELDADPDPGEAVTRLRQIAGVLRRQRQSQPGAANEAMHGLFQSILLRDGEIHDYVFQPWCKRFFESGRNGHKSHAR